MKRGGNYFIRSVTMLLWVIFYGQFTQVIMTWIAHHVRFLNGIKSTNAPSLNVSESWVQNNDHCFGENSWRFSPSGINLGGKISRFLRAFLFIARRKYRARLSGFEHPSLYSAEKENFEGLLFVNDISPSLVTMIYYVKTEIMFWIGILHNKLYLAHKRKTKILEKWGFISQYSLLLARYTWPSDAATSLTRLKNTFSGGLQCRPPWGDNPTD